MKSSRLKTAQPKWRRRLISLFALAGVCASILPLPIGWHRSSDKDFSSPFPCQNRPCGCKSAAQCWKQCCCFSNSQKLAWAKENHVAVPSYVSVAAAKEKGETGCRTSGCCARCAKSSAASCEHDCQIAKDSHLPENSCSDEAAKDQQAAAGEQTRTTFVLGMFWHKCQGHNWLWNSLPWAIVCSHQESIVRASDTGEFVEQFKCGHPQLSSRPPVRPPRSFLRDQIHS